MNLGNLIKNLEANGMPYQVQDGKNEGVVFIGVPTQRGDVWYWFKFYMHDGEELTGEEYVFFEHRYNRNYGTSLRSVKTGMRFEDRLRQRDTAKLKKRGEFDAIFRRSSNGLIGNGVNPLIN